jgi:hypothetical protein
MHFPTRVSTWRVAGLYSGVEQLYLGNRSEYDTCAYRVSQEEYAILREGVPYVKIYRYNQKHLCPKLNGYGDNGQRKCGHVSVPRTIPNSCGRYLFDLDFSVR